MGNCGKNDGENDSHNEPDPEGGKHPDPGPGDDAAELENYENDTENCAEADTSFRHFNTSFL